MAESSRLDLGAPPTFKGDRSRTEAFLAHCKLLIKAQPKKFDQDEKKIAFILSYMKEGIAEQWKTQFIRDRDNENNPRSRMSYEAFIKEVEETFKPLDKGRRARDIIDSLHQGQSSVDAYISAFNSLARNSGYDQRLLIKKFEDGLNKEIKVKVLESRIDCDALEEEKANTRLAKIQELAIEAQRILKIVQKSTQRPSKIYPDQVQDQFSDSPKGYEAPSTTWATYTGNFLTYFSTK
jgi:hypothetical protein